MREYNYKKRFYARIGSVCKTILCLMLTYSCSSDNAPDCFQKAGQVSREEVVLVNFTKISVFENVSLVLKKGDVQKVEIETGEFLRDEVSAIVTGDRLIIRDRNDCNYFRNYGITKVFVTAPNVTEIRSSTGRTISSEGVLDFPSLTLFSESFLDPESETTDGAFDLELDTQNLSLVVNGISYFKLKGNTANLDLTIAAGDSRIDAENLIAQNVSINHRGSNDMSIDPQLTLTGVIRGTGDVVSYNRPATVNVEVLYKGKLVFK